MHVLTLTGAGPDLSDENLLQSIAAALHLSSGPLTGQNASRAALQKNPGVSINTDQPLVQVCHTLPNILFMYNNGYIFLLFIFAFFRLKFLEIS